jgi:hypothetical protein
MKNGAKETTEMGENRTGIALAPEEAEKTFEGAQEQAAAGTEKELVKFRTAYIKESDGVGSLPETAHLNGATKKLKVNQKELLLDKLSEREAFERMGVRLYEALITKVECSDEQALPSVTDLRHIRSEELEHFHLVKQALENLGGDATSESPCADVSGVASRGIMQVITDPRTTVAQSLSAIMIAELADNAGWELLIELCDTLGLEQLSAEFGRALDEEGEHLQKIRGWLSEGLAARAG